MTRLQEVQDVLNIDIELAVPRLYEVVKQTGVPQEIDWPCGLALRVTLLQAQIVVSDPDEAIMDAVLASGRSFLVV